MDSPFKKPERVPSAVAGYMTSGVDSVLHRHFLGAVHGNGYRDVAISAGH
jgi:hypothetical protein